MWMWDAIWFVGRTTAVGERSQAPCKTRSTEASSRHVVLSHGVQCALYYERLLHDELEDERVLGAIVCDPRWRHIRNCTQRLPS
mgnify:CR=1 FL=1